MPSLATELATEVATKLATEDERNKLKEDLRNWYNKLNQASDKATNNLSKLANSSYIGDDEITSIHTELSEWHSMLELVRKTYHDRLSLLDKGKTFSKEDATKYIRLSNECMVKWIESFEKYKEIQRTITKLSRSRIDDRLVEDLTGQPDE